MSKQTFRNKIDTLRYDYSDLRCYINKRFEPWRWFIASKEDLLSWSFGAVNFCVSEIYWSDDGKSFHQARIGVIKQDGNGSEYLSIDHHDDHDMDDEMFNSKKISVPRKNLNDWDYFKDIMDEYVHRCMRIRTQLLITTGSEHVAQQTGQVLTLEKIKELEALLND